MKHGSSMEGVSVRFNSLTLVLLLTCQKWLASSLGVLESKPGILHRSGGLRLHPLGRRCPVHLPVLNHSGHHLGGGDKIVAKRYSRSPISAIINFATSVLTAASICTSIPVTVDPDITSSIILLAFVLPVHTVRNALTPSPFLSPPFLFC